MRAVTCWFKGEIMNRRCVKIGMVVVSAVGLTGLAGATAWADAFTPAIEEPTCELKLPQGPGFCGGSPDGNSSSAQGRAGRDLGYDPYGYDAYEGSGSSDSSDDEVGSRSMDGNYSSAQGRDGRAFGYDDEDSSAEGGDY